MQTRNPYDVDPTITPADTNNFQVEKMFFSISAVAPFDEPIIENVHR
jgi:hypothetical protein